MLGLICFDNGNYIFINDKIAMIQETIKPNEANQERFKVMRVLTTIGTFLIEKQDSSIIVRSNNKTSLEKLSKNVVCSDTKGYFLKLENDSIGVFSQFV